MAPKNTSGSHDRHADIVVGVDGSPSARSALRWAAAQAELTGARIRAITAWEYPVLYGFGPSYSHEDLAAAAGKILSESVQQALGPTSRCRWRKA